MTDYPHQSRTSAEKITIGLERISEAFRVSLWQQSKVIGISPLQIQILLFIESHSKAYATVTYLAREFHMTKPTISEAVKVLVTKEYLKKNPSEIDKRAFSLELSDRGKKAVEQAQGFSDPVLRSIRKHSPSEQAKFFVMLTRILGNLDTAGLITVQRSCRHCRFFKRDDIRGSDFCQHFDQYLLPRDIRVDCPEFEEG